MEYSIDADNYWAYDFCEDCDDEESPACGSFDDFHIAVSEFIEAVKSNCDISIDYLNDVISSRKFEYGKKRD